MMWKKLVLSLVPLYISYTPIVILQLEISALEQNIGN